MADTRERIVKRVAKFFKDGDLVNLGIGMPTMVANYIPADVHIMLQSETAL
jgi:acetate CoA/acetoacetate CoA-transferase beta subunit